MDWRGGEGRRGEGRTLRTTPWEVMVASRTTPPEDPSRAMASASAVGQLRSRQAQQDAGRGSHGPEASEQHGWDHLSRQTARTPLRSCFPGKLHRNVRRYTCFPNLPRHKGPWQSRNQGRADESFITNAPPMENGWRTHMPPRGIV